MTYATAAKLRVPSGHGAMRHRTTANLAHALGKPAAAYTSTYQMRTWMILHFLYDHDSDRHIHGPSAADAGGGFLQTGQGKSRSRVSFRHHRGSVHAARTGDSQRRPRLRLQPIHT